MLSVRQRLFAEAREQGLGITASAIQAGCPEKTAAQAGSRLDKHPAVIQHRERLRLGPPSAESRPQAVVEPQTKDPKEYLESVVASPTEDPRIKLEAAKALLPYTHKKLGDSGKKEQRRNAAAAGAEAGKFARRPRLSVVK